NADRYCVLADNQIFIVFFTQILTIIYSNVCLLFQIFCRSLLPDHTFSVAEIIRDQLSVHESFQGHRTKNARERQVFFPDR
ncbi:hypothetical protein, partial [Hungatella effluvii]|uniref:hypothetical protein n=1 Tax=Hungatella effluvii TaxID=1096246 RepID=UPI002A82D946